MRTSFLLLAASFSLVFPSLVAAANPYSVALASCDALFVEHDLTKFKRHVSPDAVQGNRGPGSAIAKLEKQTPEMMANVELAQIVFFRIADIDQLEKRYPDDLWTRVRQNIGEQQGVLVKFALTGQLAERARAAGKDPRDIAMITFIVNNDEDPKIVHIDDN